MLEHTHSTLHNRLFFCELVIRPETWIQLSNRFFVKKFLKEITKMRLPEVHEGTIKM